MSYELACAICKEPVNLEESKTDEHGRAVHENCYIWTVKKSKDTSKASPCAEPTPFLSQRMGWRGLTIGSYRARLSGVKD
jgi:hypothetical protein